MTTTPQDGATPRPASRWQLGLRIVRCLLTAAVLALLLLVVVGQVIRDRSVPLAYLFYLPLLPVGLWAVLQDAVFAGRCLPRPRFGLALLGLAAAGWSAWSLTGFGGGTEEHPGRPVVHLLHWNVRWGGKPWSWPSVMTTIKELAPDVVVLSEAPHRTPGWFDLVEQQNGWS